MQNYHTHTCFCDGKSFPEEIVLEAIKLGFSHLGFSSHSPLPFVNDFAIEPDDYLTYCREIRRVKHVYQDQIAISLGLEADFIPGITSKFDFFRESGELDYIIGGVHLVKVANQLWFTDGPKRETYDNGIAKFFGGDAKKAVTQFFLQSMEMVSNERFEIIAHLDKINMHNGDRFFKQEEKWYQKLVHELLDLIKEKEIIVEINTRGIYKARSIYYFLSQHFWPYLLEKKIPIIVSTDAHHYTDLNRLYAETVIRLKDAGFVAQRRLNEGIWSDVAL